MQGPESTCWTLVEHAAAGDAAAREEFGRRYLPVVRAYLFARWTGRLGAEELEDAVQDVFVAFLREKGVLENLRPGRDAAFRPLLYAVVRNMALRIERTRARKLDTPRSETFRADENAASEESLSRVFDRAWAASVMREALALQADRARAQGEQATRRVELLRLVFHQGLAITAVAATWGVDADALQKEVGRAKGDFKEALRSVVAFHNPQSSEAVERECRELLTLLG